MANPYDFFCRRRTHEEIKRTYNLFSSGRPTLLLDKRKERSELIRFRVTINDVISTKKVMMMKIAKSIAMKTIMLIMMVLVTASYSYSYSSSIGRTIRPWSQQFNHNYYRPLSTTTYYTTSKKITNLFSTTDTDTSTTTDITTSTIRLSSQHLTQLRTDGYVSIPNFLPSSLTSIIRKDINNLRDKNNNRDDNGTRTTLFKKAGIGAGSSNKLNEEVRFAETCFLSMIK